MPPLKSEANQQLAKAIRAIREEQGHSQDGFATHADIDRSYYGQVERGQFNISVDTIMRIAAGLDIPPSEIFKRAEM